MDILVEFDKLELRDIIAASLSLVEGDLGDLTYQQIMENHAFVTFLESRKIFIVEVRLLKKEENS